MGYGSHDTLGAVLEQRERVRALEVEMDATTWHVRETAHRLNEVEQTIGEHGRQLSDAAQTLSQLPSLTKQVEDFHAAASRWKARAYYTAGGVLIGLLASGKASAPEVAKIAAAVARFLAAF